MKNRYRNLWAKMLNVPKPDYYENDAKVVGSYRGVMVYKRFAHGYDFVIGGACITQRAGVNEMQKTIDEILDGGAPVADVVADHLRSLGFKALTYDEAIKAENLEELVGPRE